MNDAPSPTDSIHSLDRRDFVRKSAFATGALTFAGLISAGHAGPPSTTTNTTVVTTGYGCLWELREFPGSSDSDTGFLTKEAAELAANTKLRQRISEATFIDDDWGSTSGLTHYDPPYVMFAGYRLIPNVYFNVFDQCWEYTLNIPASEITFYHWR